MGKNKGISIMGVILSSIALIISIVEIFFCVLKGLSIILMPILLMLIMLAVLTANIVNLKRIINHNKISKNKGRQV